MAIFIFSFVFFYVFYFFFIKCRYFFLIRKENTTYLKNVSVLKLGERSSKAFLNLLALGRGGASLSCSLKIQQVQLHFHQQLEISQPCYVLARLSPAGIRWPGKVKFPITGHSIYLLPTLRTQE